MRKITTIITLLMVLTFTLNLVARSQWGNNNFKRGNGLTRMISSFPSQPLNEDEKNGLIKMRQEEKLARDVYLKLYEKWGLPIFSNIAESEQRHMDAIKALLDKYGIADPITNNSIGVFKDNEFTDLYNNLVNKGLASITEALKVGATIEDLDIEDLKTQIEKTDNDDIKFVYNRLMNGSFNHLRAFSRMLKNYGQTYTPQYISQEEYNSIISQDIQRGKGKGRRGGCLFQNR